MGKAPAFQLYAADFYVDTAGWTAAEVGAYVRILLHQWCEGPFPNRMSAIARIAGVDPRNMKKMWAEVIMRKFITVAEYAKMCPPDADFLQHPHDANLLVNYRLEDTRRKQEKYRENQAIHGSRGANKRWKKDRLPHDNPNGKNMALQSSSSNTPIIPLSGDGEIKPEKYSQEFLTWYSAYPVHRSKGAAWRVWERLNGKRPPLSVLLEAVEKQKEWRTKAKPGEFRPEWKHPSGWLNQACWDDDVGDLQASPPIRQFEPGRIYSAAELTDAEKMARGWRYDKAFKRWNPSTRDLPDLDKEWEEQCREVGEGG